LERPKKSNALKNLQVGAYRNGQVNQVVGLVVTYACNFLRLIV